MNMTLAGYTFEEVIEMGKLIQMGGIKYDLMLKRLVELVKENSKLKQENDNLNLCLNSIQEVINICN